MGISAGIMATLAVANTTVGVINDRKNAKAAKKQGAFEGTMYDQQAADALARGDESVSQLRAGARVLTGSQRALLAAQGVDISSGSAADVIHNDQALSELDALTIEHNAQREAHGFSMQADFARMGGRNQAAAYRNQSYGTLLSGAGSLMSIYQSYGQNKKPNTTTGRTDVGRYAQ